MEQKRININYKDDLDFLLKLESVNGKEIGIPPYDFRIKLYTAQRKSRTKEVSCIGGVWTNAYDDNGQIHVKIDNPCLGLGQLFAEFHSMIPDELFADGTYDRYVPLPTDIWLVSGKGDMPDKAQIELVLPTIKGEDGKPFTYADFTPEQIAELQKPATEAGEFVKNIAGKQLFCDLFNAAACNSGHAEIVDGEFVCELNGVSLTYEEAMASYTNRQRPPHNVIAVNDSKVLRLLKTNLWCTSIVGAIDNKISVRGLFSDVWRNATVLNIECGHYSPNINGHDAFLRCLALKEIKGIFALYNNTICTFQGCKALETFRMKISANSLTEFDFKDSPFITKESFRWMIDNAQNQLVVTITVHADIYARLTDESNAEWHQLMLDAAAKNISFVTI